MKTTQEISLEIKKEIEREKKAKITNKRQIWFGFLCLIIVIATIPFSKNIQDLCNKDLDMLMLMYGGTGILMTMIGTLILPILPIQKTPLIKQEEVIEKAKKRIKEREKYLEELKEEFEQIKEKINETEGTIKNLKFVAKEFVCNL